MCLVPSIAITVPFIGEIEHFLILYVANSSSSTLSHDFYQVMVGSKSMSLHGWRVLAEWSLEHSCMTPSEKSHVKKKWIDSWNEFCQWIIDEYGDKYAPATRPAL